MKYFWFVVVPKPNLRGRLYKNVITSLALSKHHVNLLLQSFRSVSSELHQSYNSALLALMKSRLTDLYDITLYNIKFTWCFHKAKLVLYSPCMQTYKELS